MQNVQLKQTQETDVVAPLRAYLSQHFTDSEFHQLEPALDDLRQFRDQVRLGCQRGQLDYDRLSHSHEEYLAFLVGLGDRFPFGAHATGGLFKRKPVKTVMIQWLWSDAYRPQKFAVDYTLQFELSAVTFNLAAIQTYQALSYERDSANGVQAAAKCFMKAAGIFQHMATAMSVHVPGYDVVDLSSSSLNYLSTCMLAQAASCSFENAVMKPMAPAVLAVLAMGVSETYASARTILKGDPQLVSWIAKSDFIDERFLTYQLLCFEAAANYWQSQKDEADAAYGVVVARLQNAKAVLQSCLNVEPKADSVRASRKKLQDAIELRLKSAVRDNDTIYHYPVPSAVELPAIQSKLVVKPVPFAMPKAKLPKVFDRLVPVEVQVAIQRFKTEMGDEIAKISETCSESSELARESLAQMNLPAALDALDADNAMPAEITTRIENIQAKGGLSGLDQLHAQVVKSAASSWEMYNEISSLLKQEQANEDKFRSTYGAKWERTPSKDITSTYYRDLGTVSKYLSQAKEADLKVSTKLDQSRESLAMISKPLPDIEASLPVLDASEKTEASERVRAVLRDLSSLLRKRERLLEQFMEAVGAHDPTSSIMAKKSEVGVDEVLRDEKNAFESNRQQIDENLAKQSGLFDTLVEANQAFIASRTKSTQLDERQRCLQRINDAVATFEKLEKNLTEGLSFYTDLLKDYLTPLKENVLGYATARDHEARLLLDDLSKHFAQATTLNSQGPPTPVGLPSPSRQQAHQVPPSQHAYQVPPNQQAYQVPPNQQAYQMPPSQQVYQQAPMQPPVQPAMQQHAFLPPSYQAPYQSGPSLPRNPFESPPTSPASNPFAPPPPDPSAPSAPPYY